MRKNTAPKRTPPIPTPVWAVLAVSAALAATLLLLPEFLPGRDSPAESGQAGSESTGPAPAVSIAEPVPAGTSPWTLSSTAWLPTAEAATSGTARPNPFIAKPTDEASRVTTSADSSSVATTVPSSAADSVLLPTVPTLPRYANESNFFLSRLPILEEALRSPRFFTGSYELDIANPTRMVVLSDTQDRAANLDGFFRIAVDLDGETWGGSPLALGISRLYTEGGRDRAYADGTFASDNLDLLLDEALRAMLGDAYEPGITGFVLQQYQDGMAIRAQSGGASRPASKVVASFAWLDVVFTDGFATYVEFYPNPAVSKAG